MPSKLRKPQHALGDYLEEMLHQATEQAALKPAPALEPADKVLLPADMLLPPEAAAAAEDIAAAPATKHSKQPQTEAPPAADDSETRQQTAELEFPLQCLMFRVGEHLLSVPLVQLSSVVNWSDAITRLPQSPAWLLGLIKVRDMNLRVVDSTRLLEVAAPATEVPEQLLVLEESGWAITCDHLEQVVNLEYEDVQWKADAAGGMVLGTIRDTLSTLLSPPGIAAELDGRGQLPAGD